MEKNLLNVIDEIKNGKINTIAFGFSEDHKKKTGKSGLVMSKSIDGSWFNENISFNENELISNIEYMINKGYIKNYECI